MIANLTNGTNAIGQYIQLLPSANLVESSCYNFEMAQEFCKNYFIEYLSTVRAFETLVVMMFAAMIWWYFYTLKQRRLAYKNLEAYKALKEAGYEPFKPNFFPKDLITEVSLKIPRIDGIELEKEDKPKEEQKNDEKKE